jgi:predicted SnoaL-like aldol condensation-catalyzing enzyme
MSGDPYIEHSPNVPKGAKNLFEGYQKHYGSPEPPKGRVVRMIAEGDVVLAHNLYVYPGNKEIVSVELVRVWDDKFVEHWDIQEPVPPPEMFKNKNGMY